MFDMRVTNKRESLENDRLTTEFERIIESSIEEIIMQKSTKYCFNFKKDEPMIFTNNEVLKKPEETVTNPVEILQNQENIQNLGNCYENYEKFSLKKTTMSRNYKNIINNIALLKKRSEATNNLLARNQRKTNEDSIK